jgi:hypothetical protein
VVVKKFHSTKQLNWVSCRIWMAKGNSNTDQPLTLKAVG